MTEKVRTFQHEAFGTCIAASTDIAKGEAVLFEKALMLVPANDAVPLKEFSTAIAFASAPPALCARVLSELYIPDANADPSLVETKAFQVSVLCI